MNFGSLYKEASKISLIKAAIQLSRIKNNKLCHNLVPFKMIKALKTSIIRLLHGLPTRKDVSSCIGCVISFYFLQKNFRLILLFEGNLIFVILVIIFEMSQAFNLVEVLNSARRNLQLSKGLSLGNAEEAGRQKITIFLITSQMREKIYARKVK